MTNNLHNLSPEYRQIDEMERYYNMIGDRYGLWLIEKYKETDSFLHDVYQIQYALANVQQECMKKLEYFDDFIMSIEDEKISETLSKYVDFLTLKIEKIDELLDGLPIE